MSLVLGGGHSIGVPLAVAAKKSFIAVSAAMTIHPVRMNGTIIAVPQAFEYLAKIQERIVDFITSHSHITAERLQQLMRETGQLTADVGTVISGNQAAALGLIDEVGTLSDALEALYTMIGEHKTQKETVNNRLLACRKKQYLIFMLRAAARIQSNLLCKFINSGSMYLGIYTREEKMCPQDAVFLRDSLESVVSSERLFGKQSFSTASSTAFVNQRQCLKNQVYDFGIFMVLSCAGRCRATSCRISHS